MFIAPFFLYYENLSINANNTTLKFSKTEVYSGFYVSLVWIFLLYVFIRIFKNFFKIKNFQKKELFIYIRRKYYYITTIFISLFLYHIFFIAPIYFENILHLLSIQIYPILGIGIYYIKFSKNNKFFIFYNIFLWILLLFIPISLGNITYFIYAMSSAIMSFIIFRVRYLYTILLLILLFIIIIIFSPIKNSYRLYMFDGAFNRKEFSVSGVIYKRPIIEVLEINSKFSKDLDVQEFKKYDPNSKNIFSGEKYETLHYMLAKLAHRINHLAMLVYVMNETPGKIPYWEISLFRPIAYSIVPRLIWAEKPYVGNSHEFGHRYGLIDVNDHVTSVNIDPITGSWMIGGFKTVITNAIVIGMFFGLLFSWLKSGGDADLKYFFGNLLGIHLVTFESELTLTISGIFQLFLMTGVFIIIRRLWKSRNFRVVA